MTATVWIVDDDRSITDALQVLIESWGHRVETFNSAEEFLATYRPERPGCLILDERMPGMTGRELQKRLAERGASPPVILVTGYGDVEMVVEAIRNGAVTVLQKPIIHLALVDAIAEAVRRDAETRTRRDKPASFARLRGHTGGTDGGPRGAT